MSKVGVIGAGTMGSGIAQKFAQEGFDVVMIDTKQSFVDRGMENIRTVLSEGLRKGLFTQKQIDETLGRIQTHVELSMVDECNLIVEAIFEDFGVKSELLRRLSDIVRADTVVATNTSSFSISELAQAMKHPERFIGLHFFYHAAKNRLLEVIPGKKTSRQTIDEVWMLAAKLGKDPILCRDSYGFVVNRFFVPWLNEAARILEEGVASASEIDLIARKIFGVGMGPFALMNATGVTIAYHAQRTLEQGFGSFYRPAEVLTKQAEMNREWVLEGTMSSVDDVVEGIVGDRLMGVVFLICGQILDEGITTPGELNRGARIGLRWKKGPVEWMWELGERRVQQLAGDMAHQYGISLPRSLRSDSWNVEFVKLEKFERNALLTITRPEDLNALNEPLVTQLSARFSEAETDENVETILITGQGKAFMAGADIKFFVRNQESGDFEAIRRFTEQGQRVLSAMDNSSKKVVALVNGLALGGGLELALAADSIIAIDKAMMAFPETGIGIYPGLGGTVRLPARIGRGLAKYLIYTGAFLNAFDAKAIGLVDEVVTLDEMQEMITGHRIIPERPPVALSPRWQAIGIFFEKNSLNDILSGNGIVPEGLSAEKAAEIEDVLRKKAPVALSIAEELLNEGGGFESELAKLEAVFSTKDARIGLKSVGGKPPQFQGA